MSPKDQLQKAYENWRSWTQSEATALDSADWPTVARCQAAKADLEPVIFQLTEAAEREWRQAGVNPALGKRAFRGIIQELIDLEKANQQKLGAQRQKAKQRHAELILAKRNLSRMHRSYATSRPANWHSYS